MTSNLTTTEHSSISYTTLSQAPTQVSIDGKELRLDTYIWRDFMPRIVPDDYVETCPIPGSSMMGELKISTVDGSEFPRNVQVEAAWIILDESHIWMVPIADGNSRFPGLVVQEISFRNGPKWGPRAKVSVVVQLTNRQGKINFLQAKNQTIHRTE